MHVVLITTLILKNLYLVTKPDVTKTTTGDWKLKMENGKLKMGN